MSDNYNAFHGTEGWLDETLDRLKGCGKKVVVRQKLSHVPLEQDLYGAHCLVTHGSVVAVEAAIYGCPVFVDASSAAAEIGRTDLDIDNPATPDRSDWLAGLAAGQFTLNEILAGKPWETISCG